MLNGVRRLPRRRHVDLVLALCLATTAGLESYTGARLIDARVLCFEDDIWFEADLPRVVGNMTNRWSNHYRTDVHPLFSLATAPVVYGARWSLDVTGLTALRLFVATVAAFWASALYAILRSITHRRLDSVLLSLLALVTSAAIFWLPTPETYALGSLSILVAFVLVVVSEYRDVSPFWYVVVSGLTLSFTVTNWMVGIFLAAVYHPWKRALRLTANAFCVVVVLWGVQKLIFPTARFFLGSLHETKYLVTPDVQVVSRAVTSFLFHTIVMPTFQIVDAGPYRRVLHKMVTQPSLPGSASVVGGIALLLWIALLSLGVWAVIRSRAHGRLRMMLGLSLLSQMVLHVVYGNETFLYALHWAPLFIVLVAFTTETRARPLALALAVMLVLAAGVNNALQFRRATDVAAALVTEAVDASPPADHSKIESMECSVGAGIVPL